MQFDQQLKNLLLHGHVQRGGRFIGDQQFRLVGQRHGDHHPLPLSARQLMRIGFQALQRLANTDQFQQFQRPLTCRAPLQAFMNFQHFTDLLFHRVQRVQRGHRLLENHRNPVAA